MKIAIWTLGTRGDVQPLVALALGLKNIGYEPLVISAKNYQEFVEGFALEYCPLEVDMRQIIQTEEAQKMARSDNPLKFFTSHLGKTGKLKQLGLAIQEEIWQACLNCDAIIWHPGMSNGYFMAKELRIPSIMASPFPLSPTKDYPAIVFYNGLRLGKLYNLISHFVFERGFWLLSRSAVREFWQNKSQNNPVSLTPASQLQAKSGMPIIYGYSEHLFSRPSEWSDNIHITGSWTLEEPQWTAPLDLINFIESGKPPLYVGFGSIKDLKKFQETIEIVLKALELSNQRAVIAMGWNSLDLNQTLPKNVFLIDKAPHTWLFPKMAAVIHHGGAGTTAAGLSAGKPTIIIPHAADQPAWGRRVYELGVGSKPIFKTELTAERLAGAIAFALEPQVVAKASKLGEKLRKEDGVDRAVRIIDSYLKATKSN
ncbi:MAG: glycosyltransferase [Pleurocapsa sp. MO_226.B13]|nr:glycosyltransferase [Pleurocapsa sp. MO_226.B13]